MTQPDFGNITYDSAAEKAVRQEQLALFRNCPIPDSEVLANLGLFLNSKALSRILFLHHIYTQIIEVPGVIVEFGTRWGQNAAVFAALRGIYDTFHRHRKIIAFDTFEGFPSVHSKDGNSELMQPGKLAVSPEYMQFLDRVLSCQERDNPLGHIKKYELRKGDATVEFEKYLSEHPETIVALAYFDFDIYEPTKRCLSLLQPRLTRGSVIGFDELNDPDSPGETVALMETFGLHKIRLRRFPQTSRTSYFVHE